MEWSARPRSPSWEIRHRAEVVEYRIEQHRGVKGFAERLKALGAV